MSSPQIENGYTPLSNELEEEFARLQLSGNQWRLIWVIIRQTYGWGKKQDRISITQFQQKTGLKRRHISRALSDLVERKIVTKKDTTFITSYGIQKDYSKWKLSPKKTYVNTGDATVTKKDTKTVTKIGAHKRKKEKNVKDISADLYVFYLKEIAPEGKTKQRAVSNIASHLKNHTSEHLRQSILNYKSAALKREPEFRKNPANFFGKREEYFSDYLPENFETLTVDSSQPNMTPVRERIYTNDPV